MANAKLVPIEHHVSNKIHGRSKTQYCLSLKNKSGGGLKSTFDEERIKEFASLLTAYQANPENLPRTGWLAHVTQGDADVVQLWVDYFEKHDLFSIK